MTKGSPSSRRGVPSAESGERGSHEAAEPEKGEAEAGQAGGILAVAHSGALLLQISLFTSRATTCTDDNGRHNAKGGDVIGFT